MSSNLNGRRVQTNVLRTKQVHTWKVEMTTVSRSQVATTRNAEDIIIEGSIIAIIRIWNFTFCPPAIAENSIGLFPRSSAMQVAHRICTVSRKTIKLQNNVAVFSLKKILQGNAFGPRDPPTRCILQRLRQR